jgi:hypothetical protein
MNVDELRRRRRAGRQFQEFAEFRRDVLAKSKAEIDQLADFRGMGGNRGSGRGRPVEAVKLMFSPKNPGEQEETAKELDRPKVGRRARRDGSVEQIAAVTVAALPVIRPFPTGTLHFCSDQRLLTIVADFGGGWDKDLIAGAFREKMGDKLKTLTGQPLYKAGKASAKGSSTCAADPEAPLPRSLM